MDLVTGVSLTVHWDDSGKTWPYHQFYWLMDYMYNGNSMFISTVREGISLATMLVPVSANVPSMI